MLKLKLQQVYPQFTSGLSFYCATFACQLIISVQVLDPRKNKMIKYGDRSWRIAQVFCHANTQGLPQC